MRTKKTVCLFPKKFWQQTKAFEVLQGNHVAQIYHTKYQKTNVLLSGEEPDVCIYDVEVFIKLFNDVALPESLRNYWVFYADLPYVLFVSSSFVPKCMFDDLGVRYESGMHMEDVLLLYSKKLMQS